MEGKVRVHELAEMFGVSTETIRRDLDRLEKEGKLRKVYGGAVRVRSGFTEPTFTNRSLMHRSEKQEIGKLAASLIEDGETVLLDNGTTTLEIMRNVMERPQVTVITNSAATGMISHELLDRFKVNKAFISAGGISLTDGITDYHLEEALLSRKMIERTEEAILVADHSKFGVTTFAQIAPLTQISMVVTDAGCSREWIDALKQLDIEIISGDARL
ncbi:hypothetical protein BGX30_003768 [Mortierella sp. GBA39]|nr:hypothetical protein BGX30_003768 [Mortierella sp. GBA39]